MLRKESGLRRMVGAACGLILLATLPAGAQTWPGPEAYANNNFDGRDQIKVTGVVEDIETINGAVVLWVNATKVEKTGFASRPGTEVRGAGTSWRVEGPGVAKLKDAASLARGTKLIITGDNWVDKSCKPSCRIQADKILVR